ncbi:MAG: c-type cytochrome [Planctomycetales bacterium]
MPRRCLLIAGLSLAASIAVGAAAGDSLKDAEADAARGWRILRTKAFVPADFDQETFDSLWKTWPGPLRSQAEKATAEERRKMSFARYGLVEAPDDIDRGGPGIGYVRDGDRGWAMSCLACHAGKVAGRVVPGLPNSHYGLATLVEDVRRTKLAQAKPLAHLDLAALKVPLGTTHGTTNSVMFGVILGALREPDMTVNTLRAPPKLLHHDMDAPPLWNLKKKRSLYVDGFAPKSHRPLMQFMLLPANDRETVYGWEDDFEAIFAWIESLEPPRYPWEIDDRLAAAGRAVFERNCATCHGTYGDGGRYVQKTIPLAEIGTDPVRFRALAGYREAMRKSWMSRYGEDPVEVEPVGYVAPPLDGVWATAPYFHNGSVPTLWHVLHPDERPAVWKRTEDGYDRARGGLEITPLDAVPPTKAAAERRRFFDTGQPGKSAAGHDFPNALTEPEKRAVLEYLKTL